MFFSLELLRITGHCIAWNCYPGSISFQTFSTSQITFPTWPAEVLANIQSGILDENWENPPSVGNKSVRDFHVLPLPYIRVKRHLLRASAHDQEPLENWPNRNSDKKATHEVIFWGDYNGWNWFDWLPETATKLISHSSTALSTLPGKSTIFLPYHQHHHKLFIKDLVQLIILYFVTELFSAIIL